MRFMHLADLHIGKKVNGFSMLDDQRYVLDQVIAVAKEQKPDGVLLAGDIYDKTTPSGEAVQLLDWFLTELARLELPVYMVSGNHDSPERLSFGAQLLEKSGLHIASIYDGTLQPIVLEDEYGPLNIYLLPFVKPIHVRKGLAKQENMEDEICSYNEAVAKVLEYANVDANARNLLLAHQLVTGAERCDSEDVSVGGIDNVNAELFADFDYVALGHIHGPQCMTRETIRYAGTLLKYSFSECGHKKCITMVELREKNEVSVEKIDVKPLHDMRVIKGEYAELMSRSFYVDSNQEDYMKVVLTNEDEIPEVLGKMRVVYPNIMALEYDNQRTRSSAILQEIRNVEQKTPIEYYRDFYAKQNGMELDREQDEIVSRIVQEIWG